MPTKKEATAPKHLEARLSQLLVMDERNVFWRKVKWADDTAGQQDKTNTH